ncbi:MAG TPA: hypothetical protein PLT00_13760 [Verrucomicrobiota bacterium]|nr:hypothetical protein [Verrucomicrobiota bacterium]HQB17764.1 hypothetical protein [Verrucomicrobiota bacterium]
MTPTMNRLWSGLVLGALVTSAAALTTDDAANPYQVVVERNVFGLKPAPRPEDVVQPPPPTPPLQVKLQGITEGLLGGKRQVLMKIMEPPAKPGEPAKERAVIMDEGEARGNIEVLAIDPVARSVKLNNNGTVTNLLLADFIMRTTAPPQAATPAPGGAPGTAVPGLPRPAVPGPGQVRPGLQPQAGIAPALPATAFPQPAGTISHMQASTPTANITRPMRTPTAGRPTIGATPSVGNRPALSLEEQAAVMEVERLRTRDAVARGEMPPLPPPLFSPPQ